MPFAEQKSSIFPNRQHADLVDLLEEMQPGYTLHSPPTLCRLFCQVIPSYSRVVNTDCDFVQSIGLIEELVRDDK